ncbi:MAG: hypothetical protein PHQ96_09810 [Candidatus Omnitrophica bacterium]|nr:hypothetical protein [Candidatus Omnitrophota bacterium]
MDELCPQCKNEKIGDGKIFNQPDYVAPRAYFRPNGLRTFALLGVNIRIENRFFVCSKCGFMWAKVSTEQLMRVIRESGTQQTKLKLGIPAEV